MNTDQHHEFKLGKWHVTPLRGVIHGPDGSRRITPKSMDVLLCLARRPGEVVDRETFQEEVWQGRAFSDDPLNKCIAELRRQLGDRAGSREYIETIPKRGYRLVAGVTPIGEPVPEPRSGKFRQRLQPIALLCLFVFAAIGVWRFYKDLTPDNDISIAVLPFANLGEPDKQYFADGVHEELIGELSRGDALAVRSRASTLQYRGHDKTLPIVAEELGVDVIVDGSVRRYGDTVRVTTQLVQADTDENLWSGSIEKSLSVASLFSIQNEIAQEIARALKVTLDDSSSPRAADLPTTSIEAYDAFMLGKFHYRRQLPGDIRESVTRFELAVALDPGFAEAWDWLAYAYNHAATGVGYLAPKEAYPKARTAALRALELEPELATAQSILGYIRAVHDRDWIGALADLERALELDPNDSGTVWSLAHVYSMLGRHDQAIRLTQDFADRFPARGRNQLEVANRLLDAGRYEEALRQLDIASGLGAEPAMIADKRGFVLVALGHIGDAAAVFEFTVGAKQRDAGAVGRLAHVYGRLGRRIEAQALLAELERRAATERISRLVFATVHAGLGNERAALDEIRAAVETGGREIIGLRNDPFFAGLHAHPEFETLTASL
ncbi:MAG: winged helix-turn-helix domain-containing protein, partial [Pseudomonadota bacterium]